MRVPFNSPIGSPDGINSLANDMAVLSSYRHSIFDEEPGQFLLKNWPYLMHLTKVTILNELRDDVESGLLEPAPWVEILNQLGSC